MKSHILLVSIASTLIALGSANVVMAQGGVGSNYDSIIHEPAADRESRATPTYDRWASASDHRRYHRSTAKRPRSTVGAGPSASPSGPFYDDSIHQSAGDRDSRGTPKYCPGGRC
jgi:hypothetical protein